MPQYDILTPVPAAVTRPVHIVSMDVGSFASNIRGGRSIGGGQTFKHRCVHRFQPLVSAANLGVVHLLDPIRGQPAG